MQHVSGPMGFLHWTLGYVRDLNKILVSKSNCILKLGVSIHSKFKWMCFVFNVCMFCVLQRTRGQKRKRVAIGDDRDDKTEVCLHASEP